MQNDVLRNTIVPWQEKGRWYHGWIDMTNAAFITSKTDQYILDYFFIDGTTSKFLAPKTTLTNYQKYRILDLKTKFKNMTLTGNTTFTLGNQFIKTNGSREWPIYPAPTGVTGECEFWAFIVEENDDI